MSRACQRDRDSLSAANGGILQFDSHREESQLRLRVEQPSGLSLWFKGLLEGSDEDSAQMLFPDTAVQFPAENRTE